eukprot:9467425-Pyramimonas_sp.AAC.2
MYKELSFSEINDVVLHYYAATHTSRPQVHSQQKESVVTGPELDAGTVADEMRGTRARTSKATNMKVTPVGWGRDVALQYSTHLVHAVSIILMGCSSNGRISTAHVFACDTRVQSDMLLQCYI